MRHIIFILFALLFSLPSSAKDDIDLFARYECSRENIIAGDSIRVNVVIYCNHPFQKAVCTTKNIKVKGGHSRLMQRRGDREQQRVRLNQGVYYAILWDSYVVGSSQVENIKFPELQFDCDIEVIEQEESYDPFDPFSFFHRPQRKSHIASGHCKCPSYTLPVVERPKRSTQEAISSGIQVA